MESAKPRSATFALVACTLGIAASATLNKLAMGTGLHPIWLNVFRLGFALLVIIPMSLRQRSSMQAVKALSKRDRGLTVLSGVMLAIHFASWATALTLTDSLVAVAIWSTFCLMTVLGSSLALRERTPLPALCGIILATIGVGICAIGASGSQLLGVIIALVAAITQAVYTLCGRAVRRHLDNTPYTLVVYSVAFICLLLCAVIFRIPTTGMDVQGIGWSIALALICTLGGHSMQNYALKYYKAPTVSTAILTEVFTGPLLVFLVFGEVPKLASMIGGAVILLGVGWYMYYEVKKDVA